MTVMTDDSFYSPSPFTYPPCHLVQAEALGTVDGEALVVMHLSNKNKTGFILYCLRFALPLHHIY